MLKIFDDKNNTELLVLDLRCQVECAQFSPVSSTMFCAVDAQGTVSVYNLSVDKRKPIRQQKIVPNEELTRVVYSPDSPMLFVGDQNGNVHSFKLSPNLRNSLTGNSEEEKRKLNRVVDDLLKSRQGFV